MMKMKHIHILILSTALIGMIGMGCRSTPENESGIFPEIEPYQTDYLKVSDLHKIYYELCGNREGKPAFVIHGGPGGGCSPIYRQFFNPEKFLIVLHDQRGAGRSQPVAEIRENTTQHLVEDIERLRQHLNLDKILLFGGSWGSTLALAYAETYPQNVYGMVLRGIFLATQEEMKHFYHGGVRAFFPEAYEILEKGIPPNERDNMPKALLKRVQDEDPEIRRKFSLLWAQYEYKIASLETPANLINGLEEAPLSSYYDFSLLENYYMSHGCFLEEGQLLRDAVKLKNIPITLVNGRYDMICPPVTAYRLVKKLPKGKLIVAENAGHWLGDKPVETALLEAVREFE